MCSIEECEDTAWVLGAQGVCNNVTNLCECPSGFSGVVPFLDFNDCHVQNVVYEVLFPAVVALTTVALLTMLYFTVIILHKLRQLHTQGIRKTSSHVLPSRTGNSSSDLALASMSYERATQEESVSKLDRSVHAAKVRRNKTHLACVVQFVFFLIGVLPLQAVIVENGGKAAFEIPAAAIILYGIGWAEFWAACWAFLYVYLKTLPDVPRLCRLLGIKSVFVRYPNLLFRTACWILFVSAAGYIISAVILVATPNNDPDAFFNIRLFPLMNVFSMFFLAVFFIPVSIIMTRIFNMALESPSRGGNMGRVKRAVFNLRIARAAMWLVAVVQVPTYAFFVTDVALRYFHIYIIMAAFVAESSVVFAAYLIATDNLGSSTSTRDNSVTI